MAIHWVIDEQTRVKHALLNRYIRPWMAILFSTQAKHNIDETVFYFDGFAGPGIYYTDTSQQETCDGSPVLVARAANDYIGICHNRQMVMFCIEKNKQCVDSLQRCLDDLNKHDQLWKVFHAEFDKKVNIILDQIESLKLEGFPMFFFIDPFGYSGYPLTTLRRIMTYPRAEVLINFMVYDLVRFSSEEQFAGNITALYGSNDYMCYRDAATPEQRQAFLLNLYCETLRSKGGASFVMPFRVNTPGLGTRPRYYLVHASQSLKALKVMKDEMWKQSDTDYKFEAIGINTDQLMLFEDPDKIALRDRLETFIREKSSIPYDELEAWAYTNTNGVASTVKTALIELENSKLITIERRERQRKSTVTSGAIIRSIGAMQ